MVQPLRGIKPPRSPKTLANAIACQQRILTVGIHLLNRLPAVYGPNFPGANEATAAFTRVVGLAGADQENLRRLGFSRSKGRTPVDLAQGFVQGRIDMKKLGTPDDEQAIKYLESLRGIGHWSAE